MPSQLSIAPRDRHGRLIGRWAAFRGPAGGILRWLIPVDTLWLTFVCATQLCVSLLLQKKKKEIHGDEDSPDNLFRCDPQSDSYEAVWGEVDRSAGGDDNFWNGYPTQEEFNAAFGKVKEDFLAVWEHLEPCDGQDENKPPSQFYDKDEGMYVTVELGEADGIWWNGPKKIFQTDQPKNVLFDFPGACAEAGMWFAPAKGSQEVAGLAYPWRVAGEFAELERWFYHGIGTTTYYCPSRYAKPQAKDGGKDGDKGKHVAVAGPKRAGGWIQWSQRDLQGVLGLTDREKLRLRQIQQLTRKMQSAGKRSQLDQDEKDLLEGDVKRLIEEGPMHSPQHGIFQWQIKSLKKQLANKCVFWSNTEDSLPNGSVADGTRTAEDDDAKLNKYDRAKPALRRVATLARGTSLCGVWRCCVVLALRCFVVLMSLVYPSMGAPCSILNRCAMIFPRVLQRHRGH